ncbi:hypothetical protein Hdeb2414_s0033g00721471 [Helianthus debilis subsp. tardiflorus]
MRLHWKAERHDKPVYVEDDKIVALYILAYKKENGKMTTVQKGANEETWYHQIVKNFVLSKDADLNAQPSTDVGSCACSCEKTKPEPRDTEDISVPNPEDPIDLESSPEPLLRTKAVKRKPDSEAAAQPTKKITRKKISKKGNLDALAAKLSPERPVPSVHVESSSVFNDDLSPSLPRTSIREQLEGIKTVEAEVKKAVEVEKPVEVETGKTVEVEMTNVGITKPKSPEVMAHGPERGKSILEEEVPVVTVSPTPASERPQDDVWEDPVNVEPRGFVVQDAEVDSPIRPDETPGDYYYRTYTEKRASDIHAPMWKLKPKQKSGRRWDGKRKPNLKLLSSQKRENDGGKFVKKDNNEKMALQNNINNLKAEIEKLKKEKAEAEAARGEARSHRERGEQREVQTCATLALINKEIEELTYLLTDQERTKAEPESAKKKTCNSKELRKLKLRVVLPKLKINLKVLRLPGWRRKVWLNL